jgi:hypothetical protein
MSSSENRLPRAYLGVLCAVLVLLPALTMAWAYNQISLSNDDWWMLGRSVLERWTYRENDPERPLAALSFTVWAVVTNDNFDVLHLMNLLVLPALSAIVLFLVLRSIFGQWIDPWRAAFAAFLVAAVYVVHPTDSSRPWLTMIVYHSTHLMLFGVMWLWCRAVLRNQPLWVLPAILIALLNNLIVESQTLVYGLMPMAVLLRPRMVWARRWVWGACIVGWYAALGLYLAWRLFGVDSRRDATLPPGLSIFGMMADALSMAVRYTVTNIWNGATVLASSDASVAIYGFMVAAGFAVAVLGLFMYVRRQPITARSVEHTLAYPRVFWVGLCVFAAAFTVLALLPYVIHPVFSQNLPSLFSGIRSRALQFPSVGLALLTVLIFLRPNRLALASILAAVFIAGGVLHQLRVTEDYRLANNYQRTFWEQVVQMPADIQESIFIGARRSFVHAPIDTASWEFTWGLRVLGAAEPGRFVDRPISSWAYNGQDFEHVRRNVTIERENLRIYLFDADGRMVPQTSTQSVGLLDLTGQPIALYTGVNAIPDPYTPSSSGELFFGAPYTPTACWSFAIIQSPDSAPSAGDALIVNQFNGDILDRRRVVEGETLNYRAILPCNFLMQVQFVADEGEPVVLTGDGEDRTGGLRESVTYRPTFEAVQELVP